MKPTPKKSVTTLLLTGLIMVAALVGCSSNADDSPDLEETTDASSAQQTDYIPASEDGPAQNVPEPRLPAVATENSEEGAQAALEYFWEAEQYARLSGLTDPLEVVSADQCEFCEESIQSWPASFEEGVWSVTNAELAVDITEVRVSSSVDESQSVGHVFFKLREPATNFYDSHGARPDESFEEPEVTEWLALMLYDATAQRWEIDWVGLEEAITWEE